MEFRHVPVLLQETVQALAIKENGIYVDGTVGGAGHSYEIASRLGSGARRIGIDQDAAAIEAAKERLAPFGSRAVVVRGNYVEMPRILKELHIDKVDGILLDIGVSSYQLDEAERGFSYKQDAPLDMRMDQRAELTAADVVNDYSEAELKRVLGEYGEERYAGSIARRIVRERADHRIDSTQELAEIVKRSVPEKYRNGRRHPARKTFQAIRIEVNHELDVLSDSLDAMIDLLNDRGRLCVITFHSLEDRIVKNAFHTAENPCICPPDFPVCVCGRVPKGKVITRKPIVPGAEEMARNNRSTSSKLRVFERIYGLESPNRIRKR